MTNDEILEEVLRKEGIFPPSVQNSHYSDKAEMTRSEIIDKTLKEMDRNWSWGQGSQSYDEAGHLSNVIAELQRRLPYGNIKICGAFRHLNAGCCDSCHTSYPHYDMDLLDAPDGTKAWVCCAMNRAIYPQRYAERMERFWNSPNGKLWREMFGDDDRPED